MGTRVTPTRVHYQPSGWTVPYCGSRGVNIVITGHRDMVTCRRCQKLMGEMK